MLTIREIEDRGVLLFHGELESGEVFVGDDAVVERTGDRFVVAGVLVGGKVFDHGVAGQTIAFLLRGAVAGAVQVGDRVRFSR